MGGLSLLADAGQKDIETHQCADQSIARNAFDGIGKPEPLRGTLSGWWSRRIDDVNRIVYYEENGIVFIVSCRGHYDDT